mgnify:FL=1
MKVIGRKEEIAQIQSYLESNQPEFIAVYGRRRVGKTFLISNVIGDGFAFDVTGDLNGKKKEHLFYFCEALRKYGYKFPNGKPKDWLAAFAALEELLGSKPPEKRQIVFIDELPCFDTKNSGFLGALQHFWNSWASRRPGFKFIVCGSATSWMVDNIVDNKGGLHNRLTHAIHLSPFSLRVVEEYLKYKKFVWTRQDVLQVYMALGGIPYYLNLLKANESVAQNISRLCFDASQEGLVGEYARLYKSLFRKSEPYMKIVKLLAGVREGLTRTEIAEKMKLSSGKNLTEMLRNLVNCDFIRLYNVRTKKRLTTSGIYQLTDFFSIFYHSFMQRGVTDPKYWLSLLGTHAYTTWQGLSFERVCMAHIPQIKKCLKIEGVYTEYYSWRSNGEEKAQVDLVIERADRMINICEIKYSADYYSMTKAEYEKFQRRISLFREETGCKLGILPTLVTTKPSEKNKYNAAMPVVITLDDLFE